MTWVFKKVFSFTFPHFSPSGKGTNLQQTSGDEHRGVMRTAVRALEQMENEREEQPPQKPELTLHSPNLSASDSTKRNSEEWCQEFLWQIKRERGRRRRPTSSGVLVRALNEEKPPLAFLITQPGLTSGHKTLQPYRHAGTKKHRRTWAHSSKSDCVDVTLRGSSTELWSWPYANSRAGTAAAHLEQTQELRGKGVTVKTARL